MNTQKKKAKSSAKSQAENTHQTSTQVAIQTRGRGVVGLQAQTCVRAGDGCGDGGAWCN